ncbi:kynureninase [Phenylobacterium sp.]|uniref:kynureninase n=1 Tax=Phenylobacterium sp. TaxID=1871053 RepID=UPI003002D6B1
MNLSRELCAARDAADALSGRRDLFDLPDGVIYLDGNSLGALPRAVGPRLEAAVSQAWGKDLISSWNVHGWIDLPSRVGARLARLIGARPHEVIASDSTSVNLFKLAAAAVAMRKERSVIVTESGNFPTDLYILQGLRDLLGDDLISLRVVEPEQVAGALDEDVAAVVLTHVHYKSGRLHDMAAITQRAHEVGALALWDLSHSAGAVELDLNGCGVDLAVGCGYKYLNGGPGAPAFLYVAERHHDDLRSPLTGWMGHARPFEFVDTYEPGGGVLRGLCGTPPILGLTALDAALDVFDGVAMADLRAKSQALGDLFLHLVAGRCADAGLGLACPTDSALRGSQVSLSHPDGYAIVQALIERGVTGDFRAPDILRFGFAPLYVRFVDIWDAVEILRDVMASETWREPRFNLKAAVT